MNRIKSSLLNLPSIVSEKISFFRSIFKEREPYVLCVYQLLPDEERMSSSEEDSSNSTCKNGAIWSNK